MLGCFLIPKRGGKSGGIENDDQHRYFIVVFIILYCVVNLIRLKLMRDKYVPLRAWRLLGYIYGLLFFSVCLFFITPFGMLLIVRIVAFYFWEVAGCILWTSLGLFSVYLSLFIAESLIRKDAPDFKAGVKIFFNKKERRKIGRN